MGWKRPESLTSSPESVLVPTPEVHIQRAAGIKVKANGKWPGQDWNSGRTHPCWPAGAALWESCFVGCVVWTDVESHWRKADHLWAIKGQSSNCSLTVVLVYLAAFFSNSNLSTALLKWPSKESRLPVFSLAVCTKSDPAHILPWNIMVMPGDPTFPSNFILPHSWSSYEKEKQNLSTNTKTLLVSQVVWKPQTELNPKQT